MSQITCSCGNTYNSSFKFCPECATPNPEYGQAGNDSGAKNNDLQKPAKKRFTKVGESNFNKALADNNTTANTRPAVVKIVATKKAGTIIRPNATAILPVQEKPISDPAEIYEDCEDEEAEDYSSPDTEKNTSANDGYEDYEDEEENYIENSDKDYEDEENESDFEDEPEASSAKESSLPFKSKGKVLGTPAVNSPQSINAKTIAAMPKNKKDSKTKSSLRKKQPDYDPNHDGYYDDRLPAILDEVTKTSHLDVVLKISLSAVCIAALITYCIFYVQV